ncbi:hypothetical protein [Kaarinaea lacus]
MAQHSVDAVNRTGKPGCRDPAGTELNAGNQVEKDKYADKDQVKNKNL